MIDFGFSQLTAELIAALRTKFTRAFRGDVLRFSATTIVSFCCLTAQAESKFDASVGGTLRSFPLAGVIEGESGYNTLLWGDLASPFHGYLRPRLYGSTALTYNSLDAAVEFFPMAILGVRAGGEAIQNDADYSAHNCKLYSCRGRFYRDYVEAELSLGYGNFFAQLRARRERWSQGQRQLDFVDPTSGFSLKADGDVQKVYFGIAGYKWDEQWSLLFITRYAEGTNLSKFSRFPYLLVRYKDGPFQVGAGAGFFHSSDHVQELAVAGFIKYEFAPSMALP